jgi:hypothetical protein
MKRAERRAAKERMKRKARRLYPGWRKAEWQADHLACCSCYQCGNPRRHWKRTLTIQELKQDDATVA